MATAKLEVITVPCLSDNYAFVIGDPVTRQAAVVDVPEAGPIVDAVANAGWTLTTVLLTHHHWDHVDGLPNLPNHQDLKVIGAAADADRLPDLDLKVVEDRDFSLFGHKVKVIDVPGHTVGHVAFYIPSIAHVFTADSLMAMGCGRLFEGTPAQMWNSLQKLRDLPDDTVVCSGHEYMGGNMAFALSLGEDNPALAQRAKDVAKLQAAAHPTVPSSLALEKATNPFLRADHPSLKAALGVAELQPKDVFTEIRSRKDNF